MCQRIVPLHQGALVIALMQTSSLHMRRPKRRCVRNAGVSEAEMALM